eukprot:TRINITY_DN210_c0_g2_i1.p1 TRINITY_DN210_c0_g2~~TRINITY_DN210_c0_g2_i1.p1  ORF type:complete len:159 (-),score=32.58 TRINITY_DN210_c0_g2_i1:74-508(-)
MRLTAEGAKSVRVTMGLAEQESTRKRSEGEAGAKIELARADSLSLQKVNSALKADRANQVEYMIAQKYLTFFRGLSMKAEKKKIFLPYPVEGLAGMISDLPATFGSGSSPLARKEKSPLLDFSSTATVVPDKTPPKDDAFEALN